MEAGLRRSKRRQVADDPAGSPKVREGRNSEVADEVAISRTAPGTQHWRGRGRRAAQQPQKLQHRPRRRL
eukprot:6422207-Alexandrium_andersonii.AAC.1